VPFPTRLAAELLATWLAAAPPPALAPRRTTTVEYMPPLGTSVERAVPGRFFAAAVALDADQRWSEAAAAYQQAASEWSAAARAHPSPALDAALQKAERERQRSQLLASTVPLRGRFESIVTSVNPLEEGRLLRAKLMVVRAARGQAPANIYGRARAAFEEALRAALHNHLQTEPEIHLLLCATHAAAGARDRARLELAHVTTAERRAPENVLPLAVCEAALGEDDAALAHLELFALSPVPHYAEPYALRELYVANDWDRLRGRPRFESLFRGLSSRD
jgi:hypothetical protein